MMVTHLEAIDFSRPVDIVQLERGTQVVQYMKPGRQGQYFAPTGTPAESLGIETYNRLPLVYETTNEVSVLRSTAADTSKNLNSPLQARGQGGGVQYFTPDRDLFNFVKH